MRAAQLGVALATLVVTVESESDDRGLLGMDNTIAAGPLSVRTRIRIGAESIAPERLREIVTWAQAHSPVANAIHRAVPSKTEVESLNLNCKQQKEAVKNAASKPKWSIIQPSMSAQYSFYSWYYRDLSVHIR